MKHEINIQLKDKERYLTLRTDDDTFNDTNIFTSRKSIDVPKHVIGNAEYSDTSGGGNFDSWEDVDKSFGRMNSQDIESIYIDGKSINDGYIKLAEAYDYKMLFPLLYHFQITRDDSDNIVNWYPTTGSTTLQNKKQRYSIRKLGSFMDMEELLIYMRKNDL